jgi:hypothetical protein
VINEVEMERRFTVKAKSFYLSVKTGKSGIHLEERRKRFSESISLGIQCSDWLADTVDEGQLYQGKEDLVKTFCEEMEVLMVRNGSNKAGHFLEVAVFAEGGRKRAIWLLDGRGRWGWHRFVGKLRHLLALTVAKDRPPISGVL